MDNSSKYKSIRWFNNDISKIVDNNGLYEPVEFNKKDKNINVEIYKTNHKPKFMIEPNKQKSISEHIDECFNYLKDNIKKINNTKTLITKTINKSNNFNTIIRTKKYNLKLNNNQHSIIQSWIIECKKLYNICIDKHNIDNTYFNKGYKAIKKNLFDEIYEKSKKPIPYDILTDEIRIFDSNLKSCRTNYKNGNIKYFKLKKKLKLNTNYSLLIPSKAIFKTGIFKKFIGEINGFNLNTLPNHDCRLYYNSYENKYTLNIPTDINCKKIENRESICAIDPGEKKFISFYGSQSYGFIGDNIRKPLLVIRDKIKRYQKILSNGINRKGDKIKHIKQVKTKIKKLYKKSKNIVKELHNQSTNYLCKNYDKILIPKFETQKMILNKQTFKKSKLDFINTGQTEDEKHIKAKEFTKRCKLNKSVKYVLNNLSHNTFRQHLLDKSKEYGCQCIIVTEEYTSCVCSACGHISNIYEDRIKYCDFCKHTVDRDYNGARNILIKNINKVKWKAIMPMASS